MKVIYNDGHVGECPQEEELHIIRHTAAHIMAQAIKRLYPDAMFAYGPANEKGFYYDVDLGDKKLSDEDLQNIEKTQLSQLNCNRWSQYKVKIDNAIYEKLQRFKPIEK